MSVYYNENNPRAAEWLAGLMVDGLIPSGEIDTRSIADVKPDDLVGFVQCHFFAGIGGWPYALRLAGWPDDRPVWTGSCPCQPFSSAGRRKGFDDPRHLWPVWRPLIAERRPPRLFGEQVTRSADWLALARGDLEALGYAVGAMPIEAASTGALHLRDRFWFVADGEEQRSEGREASAESGRLAGAQDDRRGVDAGAGTLADRSGAGLEKRVERPDKRGALRATGTTALDGRVRGEPMADGASARSFPGALGGIHSPEKGARSRDGEPKRYGPILDVAHADRYRAPSDRNAGSEASSGRAYGDDHARGGRDGSDRALPDAERGHDGRERGENIEAPREAQREARQQRIWPEFEPVRGDGTDWQWAVGADGKARPVKPGIRLLAHAVSGRLPILRPHKSPQAADAETHVYSRIAALEGFGNAIDPITAAYFIVAAEDAINELRSARL